jgi:hypothetical protein
MGAWIVSDCRHDHHGAHAAEAGVRIPAPASSTRIDADTLPPQQAPHDLLGLPLDCVAGRHRGVERRPFT